jgi:putative FmdB family regulatory protein
VRHTFFEQVCAFLLKKGGDAGCRRAQARADSRGAERSLSDDSRPDFLLFLFLEDCSEVAPAFWSIFIAAIRSVRSGKMSLRSSMEVVMPTYEFWCEDCHKPFEIILTLAEYEKDKIQCPKCGGKHVHQEAAAFFAVTSKKS